MARVTEEAAAKFGACPPVREYVGVLNNGSLVYGLELNKFHTQTGTAASTYCGFIERIQGKKPVSRFYLRRASSNYFFNPNTASTRYVAEWKWVPVERQVFELYAKFLESKSEKYFLLAERRFVNGEKG